MNSNCSVGIFSMMRLRATWNMPTEQLNNNITTFKLNTKPEVMILLDDVKMLKGVIFFTDYVWDIQGIHVTAVKQWFQFSRRWYILHSPKKNIEHGMIEKCSLLTFFFHCDFITILNKCIFQWLFFQYGKYCFCGNEIKSSPNRVSDGECKKSCRGNSGEWCGGSWKMYIFTNK